MTQQQFQNEVRRLGMKLLSTRPTRRMVNEFDCLVGEFYGRDKIDRATFFWAQDIVGRFQ